MNGSGIEGPVVRGRSSVRRVNIKEEYMRERKVSGMRGLEFGWNAGESFPGGSGASEIQIDGNHP